MEKKELRTEQRLPSEVLPEYLQKLTALLVEGEERSVQTIDASLHGFGFLCEGQIEDFIVGSRIALVVGEKNEQIYGIIIHSNRINNDWVRVGIRIQPTIALEKYQRTIKELLKNQKSSV